MCTGVKEQMVTITKVGVLLHDCGRCSTIITCAHVSETLLRHANKAPRAERVPQPRQTEETLGVLADVLSGKHIITFRTRQGWKRRGKRVKPDAEGLLVPFIPTNTRNIHIRRVRVFHQGEVQDAAKATNSAATLTDGQRYKPLEPGEPMWWSKLIFYKHKPRRGRPRWRPSLMDKYWFTPPRDPMKDHDFDNVAPNVCVIYPAQGLGRRKKQREERACVACGKPFAAKRKDAHYCSVACRKWASRQPSAKPENDGVRK